MKLTELEDYDKLDNRLDRLENNLTARINQLEARFNKFEYTMWIVIGTAIVQIITTLNK